MMNTAGEMSERVPENAAVPQILPLYKKYRIKNTLINTDEIV